MLETLAAKKRKWFEFGTLQKLESQGNSTSKKYHPEYLDEKIVQTWEAQRENEINCFSETPCVPTNTPQKKRATSDPHDETVPPKI